MTIKFSLVKKVGVKKPGRAAGREKIQARPKLSSPVPLHARTVKLLIRLAL